MLVLTAPSYNNDSINVNCCHVEPFDMLRAGSVKHLAADTAYALKTPQFDEMLHFVQHDTEMQGSPMITMQIIVMLNPSICSGQAP